MGGKAGEKGGKVLSRPNLWALQSRSPTRLGMGVARRALEQRVGGICFKHCETMFAIPSLLSILCLAGAQEQAGRKGRKPVASAY